MRRTKELRKKMLGFAGMLMLMCFMFVHFSMECLAAEGKVTATSAKIRKEASTTSDVLGGATQNQVFTITGETTGTDGYVWYQVVVEGNTTGYIRSDLMQKTGDTPADTPANTTPTTTLNPSVPVTDVQPISATITGASVRVRSDASTNGQIITNVVRDVVVTVNGTAKDEIGNTWYRVSFSSDNGEVQGFIREDFMSVSGEVLPVVNEQPSETTPEQTPPAEGTTPETPVAPVNDYEVVKEGDVWYLVDNVGGYKYDAKQMITATIENQALLESYQNKIASQKRWVVVLVIMVIALGVLATLLFIKVKEVMDEAYFTAIEKETIRQRQGQKANNGANTAKNKSVMQTVGAEKTPVARQNPAAKTNAQKNAQQRPAGTVPQTVKVSNPADTRVKPVQKKPEQTKTAEQRPAAQRPAAPKQTTQKPVASKPVEQAPAQKPVEAAKKPTEAEKKPATSEAKKAWQSKNFMADDEDDLEFEFLNWDGSDEN